MHDWELMYDPKFHEGVNALKNLEILAVDYNKRDVMVTLNYNKPDVLLDVRFSKQISRLL